MLVRERMTVHPVTITQDTSVPDALRIMRERKVRRLPVLDSHGHLVGIVSDKDLLHAAPSPATTLAIWEITDLLAKLKVSKIMTREVITVTEDTPLEEAACLMADHKIGGLPVMREKTLVGIITETDLFKSLLELMGGRRPGVRMTVLVQGVKGTLAKVTEAIFGVGGNIVGLGILEMTSTSSPQWEIMLKVQDVDADTLVAAVRPVVSEIVDVRQT